MTILKFEDNIHELTEKTELNCSLVINCNIRFAYNLRQDMSKQCKKPEKNLWHKIFDLKYFVEMISFTSFVDIIQTCKCVSKYEELYYI